MEGSSNNKESRGRKNEIMQEDLGQSLQTQMPIGTRKVA